MRVDFGGKDWLYPMPVLIIGTYDENGNPNAMNAAWGMISDYTQISICLGDHKTTRNILSTGAFTVSMGTAETVVACDFVGIVSQDKDSEKMKKSGFTAERSPKVNAPFFKELPMTLECTLVSFNEDTGILVGEIVNVSAEESILTNGKIDRKKLRPIGFDPVGHAYYELGEKVGNAFSDGLKLK